jgi:hypothetical protein
MSSRRGRRREAYRCRQGLPGTVVPIDDPLGTRGRMSAVSTRTLLVLAAVTGVAILVAGAVQILLAR